MLRSVGFAALIFTVVAVAEEADADAFPKLPASAAKAKKEFDSALIEASKTQEASVRKANVKFAEDLRSLQKEATRAEKLEEAVALRDAAKYIDDSQVKPKFTFPIMFERDPAYPNLTITERGFRWSDWKPNIIGRYETTTTGGINCFHPFSNDPKTSGKMWAQLIISFDRKSAIWWVSGEPVCTLKAKGR